MCLLTNPAIIRNELRAAYTSELNRLLFDLLGAETLNSATEEQLLQYIRLVAVRRFHEEVHHQNFHSMRQKERESIPHFKARLRTLAKFCEFSVTCPNKPDCSQHINNSSDMVAGQMVAELANTDHQTKMLAEAATLTTQQQKFNRLVSLEMTDQSTLYFSNIMHCTTTVNVQRLNCKQQSREIRTSLTPQYAKPCRRCERHSHPNRSRNCKDSPAAKMTCFDCRIIKHFERIRQKPKRGSSKRSAATSMREESSIFAARVLEGLADHVK